MPTVFCTALKHIYDVNGGDIDCLTDMVRLL